MFSALSCWIQRQGLTTARILILYRISNVTAMLSKLWASLSLPVWLPVCLCVWGDAWRWQWTRQSVTSLWLRTIDALPSNRHHHHHQHLCTSCGLSMWLVWMFIGRWSVLCPPCTLITFYTGLYIPTDVRTKDPVIKSPPGLDHKPSQQYWNCCVLSSVQCQVSCGQYAISDSLKC